MTEADSLIVEIEGKPDANEGDKPRPIRKRGYHRALKRGETWARVKFTMEQMQRESAEAFFKAFANPIVDPNVPDGMVLMISNPLKITPRVQPLHSPLAIGIEIENQYQYGPTDQAQDLPSE